MLARLGAEDTIVPAGQIAAAHVDSSHAVIARVSGFATFKFARG